ncbi:MAG: hypothetical protein MUC47_04945, partial [Candidatus Kapabacteria bacterium]|nr:hypothetical protein [Candidatus Kapabacteria bacterium]
PGTNNELPHVIRLVPLLHTGTLLNNETIMERQCERRPLVGDRTRPHKGADLWGLFFCLPPHFIRVFARGGSGDIYCVDAL